MNNLSSKRFEDSWYQSYDTLTPQNKLISMNDRQSRWMQLNQSSRERTKREHLEQKYLLTVIQDLAAP
jgi:hypothetical protein